MSSPPDPKRPLVMVDVAIFAVLDGALRTLLVRRPSGAGEPFPGTWALPGGFVDIDRDTTLEACALRKLREKTGVRTPYLEQLGSWGNARRDPRGWSTTHVYFALIAGGDVALEKGGNAEAAAWKPVIGDGVAERLAFDHAKLLAAALERLRGKVEYTSLPAYLLPASFTLAQLQSAYEIVLGRALDKSAFRTRVLSAGLVEETGEFLTGANRPAAVYRLAQAKPVIFARAFSPRD